MKYINKTCVVCILKKTVKKGQAIFQQGSAPCNVSKAIINILTINGNLVRLPITVFKSSRKFEGTC